MLTSGQSLSAVFLLWIVLLAALPAHSADAVNQWESRNIRGYGQLDAGYAGIEFENTEFNPVLVRLSAGLWLRDGIGVELAAAGTLNDDRNAGLDLEVPSLAALAIRFQSPEDFGIKGYMLLGYSAFELSGTAGVANFPDDTSFTGPFAALGFLFPLVNAYPYSIAVEYSEYFSDKDLRFNLVSAGIRYGF